MVLDLEVSLFSMVVTVVDPKVVFSWGLVWKDILRKDELMLRISVGNVGLWGWEEVWKESRVRGREWGGLKALCDRMGEWLLRNNNIYLFEKFKN